MDEHAQEVLERAALRMQQRYAHKVNLAGRMDRAADVHTHLLLIWARVITVLDILVVRSGA